MRPYILLSILIYVGGFMIGAIIISGNNLKNDILSKLKSENNIKFSATDTVFILKNNLIAALTLILGGFLVGFPTFVNLFFNANDLSLKIFSSIKIGLNVDKVFLLILPHGIFEIPAIIIAGAAGFKIPYEIIRYLAGKKEQILTKEDVKEYLTLALISIILIVIAAWIEANITLKIAKAMLKTKGI
ncbi:MAG: hypothetical protein DSY33_05420 [Archaeoglobus sp.]|nr:MAG: hypothetical protein DSY33_05420 [Archaeoglobus sp.]